MMESSLLSYKDIEDIINHLVQTGQVSFTEYLGSGLYRLPHGYGIVNEKTLEEMDKLIRKSLGKNEMGDIRQGKS